MALSGVRSSWLILARNCDLCWLASASWRLLSWILSNSRAFSIAITAWSAKVSTSAICVSVKGFTVARAKDNTPSPLAQVDEGIVSVAQVRSGRQHGLQD